MVSRVSTGVLLSYPIPLVQQNLCMGSELQRSGQRGPARASASVRLRRDWQQRWHHTTKEESPERIHTGLVRWRRGESNTIPYCLHMSRPYARPEYSWVYAPSVVGLCHPRTSRLWSELWSSCCLWSVRSTFDRERAAPRSFTGRLSFGVASFDAARAAGDRDAEWQSVRDLGFL